MATHNTQAGQSYSVPSIGNVFSTYLVRISAGAHNTVSLVYYGNVSCMYLVRIAAGAHNTVSYMYC